MDVLLSVAGTMILQGFVGSRASCRKGINADGYVPEGGRSARRITGEQDWSEHRVHQKQIPSHHPTASDVDALGVIFGKMGVQIAGMALVSYMSARMFQYALRGSDRVIQEAAKVSLRSKLPHRSDLDMEKLSLNPHEISVASDVVASSNLVTTFDMIGGLDEMKEEIMDIITLACSREAQRQGVNAPRGILLSGVPGTGKTMLAQAIAKESGATFINVRMGAVTQKYVGEGEKIVAAIFSLAHKLAPSIIFIDEIDCFLRNRTGFEHDHVLRIKTEFMTLWDGLLTVRTSPVIVLGTTNRPADVDPAILRRLPRQFIVALPATSAQREQILRLITTKYRLASTVDLSRVALQTAGFSGSDLDGLCQAAQTVPAREFAQALRGARAPERTTRSRRVRTVRSSSSSSSTALSAAPSGGNNIGSALGDFAQWWTGRTRQMPPPSDGAAGGNVRVAAPATSTSANANSIASTPIIQMRPMTQEDFDTALGHVRPTGEVAAAFAASEAEEEHAQEQ